MDAVGVRKPAPPAGPVTHPSPLERKEFCMKEITLPKASQLTSPNPVTVVCTRKPNGSTNLATVSW